MTTCFADTSYFLALLVPTDRHHTVARNWASASRTPIVTTQYVVIEVGNFLSRPPSRSLFGSFVEALKVDPRVTVVPRPRTVSCNAAQSYFSLARTKRGR